MAAPTYLTWPFLIQSDQLRFVFDLRMTMLSLLPVKTTKKNTWWLERGYAFHPSKCEWCPCGITQPYDYLASPTKKLNPVTKMNVFRRSRSIIIRQQCPAYIDHASFVPDTVVRMHCLYILFSALDFTLRLLLPHIGHTIVMPARQYCQRATIITHTTVKQLSYELFMYIYPHHIHILSLSIYIYRL